MHSGREENGERDGDSRNVDLSVPRTESVSATSKFLLPRMNSTNDPPPPIDPYEIAIPAGLPGQPALVIDYRPLIRIHNIKNYVTVILYCLDFNNRPFIVAQKYRPLISSFAFNHEVENLAQSLFNVVRGRGYVLYISITFGWFQRARSVESFPRIFRSYFAMPIDCMIVPICPRLEMTWDLITNQGGMQEMVSRGWNVVRFG